MVDQIGNAWLLLVVKVLNFMSDSITAPIETVRCYQASQHAAIAAELAGFSRLDHASRLLLLGNKA